MSLITKVIIDTNEYNRLLKIEEEYKKLKEFHVLKRAKKLREDPSTNQTGSGEVCGCGNEQKCYCSKKTPPLSQIVALNDKAKSIDLPPRGLLPSITDPNETETNNEKEKKREKLDHNEWKMFADDKSKWYFLGHYEEN